MSEPVAPTSLSVPAHEGRLLAAHLDRLATWDPRTPVRLVARARALGIYSAPPMEVIAFVALPLTEPVDVELDTTTHVSDLRANIDEHGHLGVPAVVVGDTALAVLPPSDSWQLPIAGVSGDILPLVDTAVAEFRRRAASVADSSPSSPELTCLAQEIWDRPGFGGLPLRALHAARRLGFLSDDASRVSASTCTGWKRLTTVRGQVFVRTVPPVSRPSLSVVR
ncbi:MAG: hypothetical protein FJW80_05690 [Actinobacteria bacterium]|nr:hypothetical protein [Actinomycetota bacterium]